MGRIYIGIGGKKIIYSYSSYESPSTVLAVHGTKTRGLHPSPIMCEEEIDDLEEESFVDNDKSSCCLCPIVPILVQEEERICCQ